MVRQVLNSVIRHLCFTAQRITGLMVTAVPTSLELLQIIQKTQLLGPCVPLLISEIEPKLTTESHYWRSMPLLLFLYMKLRRYCRASACARVSCSPAL